MNKIDYRCSWTLKYCQKKVQQGAQRDDTSRMQMQWYFQTTFRSFFLFREWIETEDAMEGGGEEKERSNCSKSIRSSNSEGGPSCRCLDCDVLRNPHANKPFLLPPIDFIYYRYLFSHDRFNFSAPLFLPRVSHFDERRNRQEYRKKGGFRSFFSHFFQASHKIVFLAEKGPVFSVTGREKLVELIFYR
ncbi:unnamed protein product [Xylocopa violacea]|uniref:Maturase K n=1 Tax=Xylocopa violacea TaxID=135666 RepID=A0ABP1NW73_XYLVO